MAVTPEDLQPKDFKVTLKGRDYTAHPPRLSHRIILNKAMPLFQAIEQMSAGQEVDIPAAKLVELESEIDVVFQSLVPELKNITLDMYDVIDLLTQLIDNSKPEEQRELEQANISTDKGGESDPKAKRTG